MKNKDQILLESLYNKVIQEQSQQNKGFTNIYLKLDKNGSVVKAVNGMDYQKLAPDLKDAYMQLTSDGNVYPLINGAVDNTRGSKLTMKNFGTPLGKQILSNLTQSFPNLMSEHVRIEHHKVIQEQMDDIEDDQMESEYELRTDLGDQETSIEDIEAKLENEEDSEGEEEEEESPEVEGEAETAVEKEAEEKLPEDAPDEGLTDDQVDLFTKLIQQQN